MSTRFGPFTVNPQTRQLVRAGRDVHLSNKAFDLLLVLVGRRPDVVSKAELLRSLWPDTHVVEANLNVLIAEIRRALADDSQRPTYIRTVHRVGYAFCGDASDLAPPAAVRSSAERRFWVVYKERAFPLAAGDNVIGRHPECGIWLDESGVSRRHARITLDAASGAATLEDLNSTNGTSVGRQPIDSPRVLADGDMIQVGPLELEFRVWSDETRQTERIRRKKR